MYEYIQGPLAELTPASAVIDCGGVGYFIMITLQGYENLMGKSTAKIYVHYHVKEDGHELYGFVTKDERELFRQLISVSGIGVGTARIMLSSLSAAALREAILTENLTLLKGVKGIGLKTAQRVILELKDKVGKSDGETSALFGGGAANATVEEATNALVMLGFAKPNVTKAVRAILAKNPAAGVEDIIKSALQML